MAKAKKATFSKSAQAQMEVSGFLSELDKLATRRQVWEDGLQRAADKELHEILQVCFSLYERIIDKTALKARLSKALANRNTRQTAGSSLQLKVIRYVFGECGQEFTYARVLKEAHDRKPKNTSFVDWLASEGGPSGVKKAKVPKQKQTQQLVLAAKLHFEAAQALTTVPSVPELQPNRDADHHFAVALVRINAQGSVELVFGCNNIALTNQVLELAGKTVPAAVREKLLLNDNDDDFALTLTPVINAGAAA